MSCTISEKKKKKHYRKRLRWTEKERAADKEESSRRMQSVHLKNEERRETLAEQRREVRYGDKWEAASRVRELD